MCTVWTGSDITVGQLQNQDYFQGVCCNTVDHGGDATRPLPRDGGVEKLYGDPTVGPHPKIWTRGQKGKKRCRRWHAEESQMRDSQGGCESDPAEGVRKHCMKNSPSVFSCISKRTREGCDRGSEIKTVYSG